MLPVILAWYLTFFVFAIYCGMPKIIPSVYLANSDVVVMRVKTPDGGHISQSVISQVTQIGTNAWQIFGRTEKKNFILDCTELTPTYLTNEDDYLPIEDKIIRVSDIEFESLVDKYNIELKPLAKLANLKIQSTGLTFIKLDENDLMVSFPMFSQVNNKIVELQELLLGNVTDVGYRLPHILVKTTLGEFYLNIERIKRNRYERFAYKGRNDFKLDYISESDFQKKLSETGLKMHRVWWIHLRFVISNLWILLAGEVFFISLFVFRGNWKKQRIKSKLKTSRTITER